MESSPGSAGEKLRLMCSYGGHIVPRPHDKSLCYAGGETRLVAVHRKTAVSLSSLTAHLTKTLQFPPPPSTFTVKYQLPNHDLDSLISISTDEDLSNMLDEYDRLSSSPSPSRLRFFLFPNAADSCVGLLHDPKTEGWFIDALRSAGVKSGSGLGDSGTSLPESIPVEERERDRDNSSFGSTSSSSYSPAVRGSGSGSGGGGGCGGGDDSGAHQFQDVKVVLPSVDSLGSDSSIPSPNFSQQAIVYQDASGFAEVKAVSANVVENESMSSDRSPRSDMLTPVQVSGYILSKPTDHPPQVPSPPLPPPPPPPQHYYHHPGPQTHYVNQYYPSSVPVASYSTMYQPYVQSQQHMQYQQINKPYPVYMMAVGQAQNPYDMSMQYSVATPQTVTPSQPQVASKPVVVASQMVYEGYKPVAAAPEYAATVCKPTAVVTQPVTVSTDDHHHQVVAFPPPAAPQPVAVAPFENTNYVSEYEDPMHAQIYKTQPSVPSLPPQVQTTTNAATVILSESVTQ